MFIHHISRKLSLRDRILDILALVTAVTTGCELCLTLPLHESFTTTAKTTKDPFLCHRSDFEALQQAGVSAALADEFGREVVTEASVRWAAAILLSRSFSLDLDLDRDEVSFSFFFLLLVCLFCLF